MRYVRASDFPSKKARTRNREKRGEQRSRVFLRAILHCSSCVTRIVGHDAIATEEKGKHECQFHGTIIKYVAKIKKKKIAHVNKHTF